MALAGITFLAAIALDWEYYLYSMMLFGVFEGQGRILTGYNPVFRLLFDVLLLIGMARVFIKHKKLFSQKLLPNLFYFFLVMHFIWWTVSLFNPLGAGPLPSFATAKYYIFPFLLFFAHMLEPLDVNKKTFNTFVVMMMAIISVECILCIYQLSQGTDFMSRISGNYTNLFRKFKQYEGWRFRPWGTSHSPGGMSQYIYLTLPLILIMNPENFGSPKKRKLFNVLLYLFIALSWFTMFISQVRSAWIKHILTVVISSIVAFVVGKDKLKRIINFIFALVVFGIIGYFGSTQFPSIQKSLDLTSSISRLENLQRKGIQGQREGLGEVIHHLKERVQLPLGFGPGMCTSYLPHFPARRKQLIDIPEWHFWALDNFYAFSILELGIGAFFYVGTIFILMFFITIRTFVLFRRKHFERVRLLVPVVSLYVVTIVGNWGAVGWPFNPESFYFWLYTAIAVGVAFEERRKSIQAEEHTDNPNNEENTNEVVPIRE